jgi:hypothetical protein
VAEVAFLAGVATVGFGAGAGAFQYHKHWTKRMPLRTAARPFDMRTAHQVASETHMRHSVRLPALYPASLQPLTATLFATHPDYPCSVLVYSPTHMVPGISWEVLGSFSVVATRAADPPNCSSVVMNDI